jgi:hypothetical protein
MRLEVCFIMILLWMSLLPSSAVVVGRGYSPVPVIIGDRNTNGSVIQYNPAIQYNSAIQYNPVGQNIMTVPFYVQGYAQGVQAWQHGYQYPNYGMGPYYFGRDFLLGIVDGNYPGTPFSTQFLADP